VNRVLAKEVKETMLREEEVNRFHVIGFTDDGKHWWHIHNDEEVPESWALKPVPVY